jgi:hypothetical protein
MLSRIPHEHPLRKLFAGLVDQVFTTELGICDTYVTCYLGDMLCEFVHTDQIFRLRDVDGDAIREISKMEADSAARTISADDATRARLLNQYIGDFTLFWAGVYPEHLRTRSYGQDRLREYLLQGKRSYSIAGELSSESLRPPASLLRHLSEEFEYCVHGLHLVRQGWEKLSAGGNLP